MARRFGIFQKFTLIALIVGLLPMTLVVVVLINQMSESFSAIARENYLQMATSVQERADAVFASADEVSRMPYYYSFEGMDGGYLSADSFRSILETAGDEEREDAVEVFLTNIMRSSNNIRGAHFVSAAGDGWSHHRDNLGNPLANPALFAQAVSLSEADLGTRNLTLRPPHSESYFAGNISTCFTVGRNYFDVRGDVSGSRCVGTIYLDIDIYALQRILDSLSLDSGEEVHLVVDGLCWLSTDPGRAGLTLDPVAEADAEEVVFIAEGDYGMTTYIVVDNSVAFAPVAFLGGVAVILLVVCFALFALGLVLLSRRLSRPLAEMMGDMDRIGSGDFDINLPVERKDEIGEISQRFNEMSRSLKTYIDREYVAQLKRKEAELTSLKSQIYPHFLYNTLEIIRMKALEGGDESVGEMIEALSQQIHYVIGPATDKVPLSAEIGNVEKYVFLLNARSYSRITLEVSCAGLEDLEVPKLILQPLVENAWVHGIKPKGGMGTVAIHAWGEGSLAKVSVMNNGRGMSDKERSALMERLAGPDPGVKDEWNWKSIGLKNVCDRVKLLYPGVGSVEVESIIEIGTIVTITVPLVRTGGAEEE